MLTDRQIEILKKEDLPTEYDELTETAKYSIDSIEKMFCYLDEKYPDEHFEYSGYVSEDTLDIEHLVVDSDYGEVTVYKSTVNDVAEYEDNFAETQAGVFYEKEINDVVSETIPENNFIVWADVKKCFDDDWMNYPVSSCIAVCRVFVKGSVGEKDFKNVVDKTVDYLRDNIGKSSITINFYLVKDSEYTISLPYNFDEMISSETVIKQISFVHNLNGKEVFSEI